MQSKRKWLPAWQRVELVELCLQRGMTRREAAEFRRVSVSTVQYWVTKFGQASEAERVSGAWAQDRPSTPHRQPTLSSPETHALVCEARERTGWGPRLIASELGMAHATVSRCLQREGVSRLPKTPREEVRRFEWPCPGDLLQMDTKRLARFTRPGHKVTGDRYRSTKERAQRVGWEFCHSLIDDHSRLAYTEVLGDEKADTVTAFVQRALAFFADNGISEVGRASRPTTRGPTSTTEASDSCFGRTASSIDASRRAHPNATARSSATNRPSPENGPTDSATATQPLARQRYRSGWSTTTSPATTARSQTGHPSAAFGTTRGTTSRRLLTAAGRWVVATHRLGRHYCVSSSRNG
jgi:transposase